MFDPLPQELDTVLALGFRDLLLFVACRDARVLVYDAVRGGNPLVFVCPLVPIAIALSALTTYVALSDGTVRELDLENTRVDRVIASSDSPVNFLRAVGSLLLYTTISGEIVWVSDVHRPDRGTERHHAEAKIFCADANDRVLVLALAGNRILIRPFNDLGGLHDTRELAMHYQVCSLACYPSGEGFAVGTLDGRVLMEFFDLDPHVQDTKRFTFRCHRKVNKATEVDDVFPVLALAFDVHHGTLFTAGGDGAVCVWNTDKRRRTKMYPAFGTTPDEGSPRASVAAMALSTAGANKMLAVAVSDNLYLRQVEPNGQWQPKYPSRVYLRHLAEHEYLPRSR